MKNHIIKNEVKRNGKNENQRNEFQVEARTIEQKPRLCYGEAVSKIFKY